MPKLETEKLTDDGAPYTCCFSTFFEEYWRCPNEANRAISLENLEFIEQRVIPEYYRNHTILAGRALCDIHINVFDKIFGAYDE